MSNSIDTIHNFWFAGLLDDISQLDERNQFWFGVSDETDALITNRFGDLVKQAKAGDLDHWAHDDATGRPTLALILLLDQFTRNIHRNRPEAFASDHKALALTRQGLDTGLIDRLHPAEQVFFLLPTQHAEDLDIQKQGVAAYAALADRTPPPWNKMTDFTLTFAQDHRDIIARFGRFPHRNAVLNRESTEEEITFLASRDNWFGQG